MATNRIHVLLVEDNPADAELVSQTLAFSASPKFDVTTAPSLRDGVAEARKKMPDVVLLDLSLPDSQGLPTLATARSAFQNSPIVVLTGQHDEELGIEALRSGAQDFFTKGEWDRDLMFRSLQFAIERHKFQAS